MRTILIILSVLLVSACASGQIAEEEGPVVPESPGVIVPAFASIFVR